MAKIKEIILNNKIVISVTAVIITITIVLLVLFIPTNKMRRSYFRKQPYPKPYQQKIEKNIFQTWYDKENLPKKFKKITDYLKLQNPEYTYHLYDDTDIEQFVKTHYPEYFDSYMMINPKYGAARADFFRYMVVYHYGGVYFDIKSGAELALRNIIKPTDEFVSSGWEFLIHPEKYINWCIIAKKGHPLLKHVLDEINTAIQNYDPDRDGVGAMAVLKLTGPFHYSDIIEKHKDKYNITYYDSIKESKLVYNHTEKKHLDSLSCSLFNISKGAIGKCNHTGKKKRYNELTDPVVIK